MTTCLAFDFGAGSGRAFRATLTDRLTLEEIARFPPAFYHDASGHRVSLATLHAQLAEGLAEAGPVDSIGVDSWGLDFGLIDGADPYHYRDPRALRGYAQSPIPDADLARITRAQVLPVNTLFQLLADPPQGGRLLMMADLLNHHLSGVAVNELTLARTTGLHAWGQGFSREILQATGLPDLFGPIVTPGTPLGPLRGGTAQVIAVAGHDTASAVAALNLQPGETFLIAGSWNVVGIETADPPDLPRFGLEGGYEGRALVTRSLTGLVLLRLLSAHLNLDHGALQALAASAPQGPVLDTQDPDLVQDFAKAARAQLGAVQPAALARATWDGLAEAAAEALAPFSPRLLRMGGGGARDALLCQKLADRIGIPVLAGPVEASALGNVLFQLIGLGRLPSLDAARRLVPQPRRFDPA